MMRKLAGLAMLAATLVVPAGVAVAATGNALLPEAIHEVAIAGVHGVPADASAVVLNITGVAADRVGYATVFPCGAPRPEASNLNFTVGETVANAVVARPGVGGRVCVVGSGVVDLLVDVSGWFAVDSDSTWLSTPVRVLSTRDGIGVAKARIAAGATLEFPMSSRPSPVASAVVNLTVTNAAGAGYLTAFPCGGAAVPATSTLNFAQGETVPNLAVVRPGVDGKVCFYASATTDLIADLTGWLGSGYSPLDQPLRIVDSRLGIGSPKQQVSRGAALRITYPAPVGATAAVFNVTSVNPGGPGYLTASACGSSGVSTVNFQPAGAPVANLAVVPVGLSTSACVAVGESRSDVIVDLSGWMTGAAAYTPLIPAIRAYDSRECPFLTYTVDTTPPNGSASVVSSSEVVVRDVLTGRERVVASSVEPYPGAGSARRYSQPFLSQDCYGYAVERVSDPADDQRIARSVLMRVDLRTGAASRVAALASGAGHQVLGEVGGDTLVVATYASDGSIAVEDVSRSTGRVFRVSASAPVPALGSAALDASGYLMYFLAPSGASTAKLIELNLGNGSVSAVADGFTRGARVVGQTDSYLTGGPTVLVHDEGTAKFVFVRSGNIMTAFESGIQTLGWTRYGVPVAVFRAAPSKVVALNPISPSTWEILSSKNGQSILDLSMIRYQLS